MLGLVLAAPAIGACQKPTPDTAKREEAAVHAETQLIVVQPMPRLIPLTGTLEAAVRTELTANVSGRVVRTFVERGHKVERGALLVQLDVRTAVVSAAEAAATIASAKTQLDSARAECARYDTLFARGAITEQEHDTQIATCKQNLSALDLTKAQAATASIVVRDGTIRAPFSGIVSERLVSVGDYVQPSSTVVTLVVNDPLRLLLNVPERRIEEVEKGAVVTFPPAAMPDRELSGTIKYLSGEVTATTRALVVEAAVPNPDGALLPGMFVNVSMHTGERPMPVVPKAALFDTGQERSLYTVKDGHLFLRIVKPGVAQSDVVAIEAGVAAGESVVVNPSPSMSDGARVE